MTDSRPQDDERLIAGALRGDEEALGQLLGRDQEWAYNVAYRVLGQEADARDAVQDAYLQTVRALRGDGSPPRSIESFRPWLRRVVANAAITRFRRRPSAVVASTEAVASSISMASLGDPERLIERAETRVQVLQAMLSLTETQRVALALRELLDASYDEIGEALDLPRTAVGTLLFRARAGFRAAYDRVAEAAPPIDCPDIVPLFASILDAEPRPEGWLELEDHLRACDRCQGDLEGQRRARRAYVLLPVLAVPAGWDPVASAVQGVIGMAAGGAAASVGPAASHGASAAGASVPGLASGATVSVPAGSISASAPAGLLGSVSSAKVAIATVATVGVVGAAAVVGPFAGPAFEAAQATSPSPVVAVSPAASPELTPSPAAAIAGSATAEPALTRSSPSASVATASVEAASSPVPGSSTPAVVMSPVPGSNAAVPSAPVASPSADSPDLPVSSPTPLAAP